MVSDQEIANGVESLLRQGNPNGVTSINGVVQQLEAQLGLDLSHKAGFIRDLLLRLQVQNGHFALQHLPQFHSSPTTSSSPHFNSHFAIQNQQLHYHPDELGFRYPNPQLYPYPSPHFLQQQQQKQQHQQLLRAHSNPNVVPATPLVAETVAPEIKKESAPSGTKRRGGPGGLNKVCGVSPLLEAVVGEPALPRTQIVKQLWAYIRKHNLQDPSNKRKIICNDALRLVFETDCTDMFKMNKLLAKHIIPLDPTKVPAPDSKRLKVETESATETTEASFGRTTEASIEVSTEANFEATTEAGPEVNFEATIEDVPEATAEAGSEANAEAGSEANAEAGPSTVIISDALARFFGIEGREMPRSEAIRHFWEYIKINQLEDHLNPMMIMCDAKLQELFGCESISALDISEMLMTHIFKQS